MAKFALISVLSLIMFSVPTTLYLGSTYGVIAQKQLEWEGMVPSNQLLAVVRLLQQHRGMSASLLSGNTAIQEQRRQRVVEIEQAMGQLQQTLEQASEKVAVLLPELKDVQARWRELQARVEQGTIPAPESFAGHVNVINALFSMGDRILDIYGLSLDDALEVDALIQGAFVSLPLLSEELGKARAQGARLLVLGKASDQDRLALGGIVQRADEYLQQTQRAFDKAYALDADLRSTLQAKTRQAAEQAREALVLVNGQILSAATLVAPSQPYFDAMTRAIDVQYRVVDDVIVELEHLLSERVDHLQRDAAWLLGGLLVMALLAGWVTLLVIRSITRPIATSVAMASQVAACDLTARAEVTGRDEPAQLLQALNAMSESLSAVVRQVRTSVDSIDLAAAEIAHGNMDLSSRTESQASSLEETAASIEELTATVQQNAGNARQASELAVAAAELAGRSGSEVEQAVSLMQAINQSSRRMVDIIGVIESIAFQTNILALNASVESARAGEQGRGFAVVAAEVRTLAQRSANAAQEIRTLINASLQEVNQGSACIEGVGNTMGQVVSSIRQVADLIVEIDTASGEQTTGITQVNQAVTQIDDITQQNAALVEQAAAAATNLRDQTHALAEAVVAFRLDRGLPPRIGG
ncbi:methyl-accepting chemotaxis protein [Corticimicrobacter populi]|uniref:methyl-accepting chemotaxis protein n=1 Tax=Corticimicrobacter populi TaxID=2175229 RepID=UPI00138FE4D0|nr:methyl-accepting chemotaxis protein [Corticimicrobacter populi]